jgi:hypothetical protein
VRYVQFLGILYPKTECLFSIIFVIIILGLGKMPNQLLWITFFNTYLVVLCLLVFYALIFVCLKSGLL